MIFPIVVWANQSGLDMFLQFDDEANSRVAFTAGMGLQNKRYSVAKSVVDALELDKGVYHPIACVGDIEDTSTTGEIVENFELVLPVSTSVSGGGILSARIGVVSLTSNDYLEIIQGEEKIVTIIIEAHGRFDTEQFDSISVKMADTEGNTVEKTEEDESIERVCEALDVQVIRCTLSPDDTASLVDGLLQIEITLDSQKARLTHALKVLEQIEV